MRTLLAAFVLIPALASAAPIPKGAAKPTWIGKLAFVKGPNVTITLTLANGNTRAVKPAGGIVSYVVKDVKDDTVEVLFTTAALAAGGNVPPPIRQAATNQKATFRKDDVMKAADAIDYYTGMLKDNAKDTYYLQARAEANTAEEKFDAADADYTRLVELAPNDINTLMKRAAFRYTAKKYEAAIKDYDEIVAQNSGYLTWALQQKANAKAGLKKFDEAIADLTKLVDSADGNRMSALLTRGLMYARAGKPDKAVEDYDEIIKNDPASAIAINNKAWTYCTTHVDKFRDGKQAVELATKACELTQWANAGYIDTLAAAYAEAGDYEKAVKYQTQVMEDEALVKREGQELRDRLELYRLKKPYRLPDETKLEAKPKK